MQKFSARYALAFVGILAGALTVSSASAQNTGTNRPAVGSRNGQQAWSAVCANCHMPRRPGARTTGPRLENKNLTEARMREIIRNGEGTMRPIPPTRLTDGELEQLIAYLRTFRAVR
jgi:mono/diheme cytochrome c family protein